jgi:hypothetical protein
MRELFKRSVRSARGIVVAAAALTFVFGGGYAVSQAYQFLNLLLVGHVLETQGGAVPTATNGTITAASSDWAGQITCSSSTCAVVFATAFNVIPFCVATSENANELVAAAVTKTGITFSGSASINGTIVNWVCIGTVAN